MRVKLHILSLVRELDDDGNPMDDDCRRVEETVCGTLTLSDTGGEIAYITADENGKTESRILFPSDRQSLRILRSGVVSSEIRLVHGNTHASEYGFLGYRFPLAVTLSSLKNNINVSGGCIRLAYRMDIGGQKQKVSMQITVTGGADE